MTPHLPIGPRFASPSTPTFGTSASNGELPPLAADLPPPAPAPEPEPEPQPQPEPDFSYPEPVDLVPIVPLADHQDSPLPPPDWLVSPSPVGTGNGHHPEPNGAVPSNPPPQPVPNGNLRPVVANSGDLLLPVAHPAAGMSLASLFGFDEKAASFVTTVGTEGWENPQPARTAWDMLPSLDDVGEARDGNGNTGDSIKRLWDATAVIDLTPQHSGHPTQVDYYQRPRRHGWVWVLGGIAIITAALFIGKAIVDRSTQAVAARQAQHATTAQNLSAALNPVEDLLDAVSSREVTRINQLTNELGLLDSAARRTLSLAGEPLPGTPLVGGGQAINDLTTEQEVLKEVSAQALIMEQRLSNMVSYTQTYAQAFRMPALPDQVNLEALEPTTNALNQALAETRITLSELPDNPDFAAHRTDAQQMLVSIEALQIEYATALRNGDSFSASRAKTDMLGMITDLNRQLAGPQDTVTEWSRSQIKDLQAQLDQIGPDPAV